MLVFIHTDVCVKVVLAQALSSLCECTWRSFYMSSIWRLYAWTVVLIYTALWPVMRTSCLLSELLEHIRLARWWVIWFLDHTVFRHLRLNRHMDDICTLMLRAYQLFQDTTIFLLLRSVSVRIHSPLLMRCLLCLLFLIFLPKFTELTLEVSEKSGAGLILSQWL